MGFKIGKPLIFRIGKNVFNSINMDGFMLKEIWLSFSSQSHKEKCSPSQQNLFSLRLKNIHRESVEPGRRNAFGMILHFSKVSQNLVNRHPGSSISQPALHGTRTKKNSLSARPQYTKYSFLLVFWSFETTDVSLTISLKCAKEKKSWIIREIIKEQ